MASKINIGPNSRPSIHIHPRVGKIKIKQMSRRRPTHVQHTYTQTQMICCFFFFSSKKSKGFSLEYFIFAKSDSSFSFIYHQPTHERVRQTWIVEFLLFYRSQVAGAVLDTAHNVQVSVRCVQLGKHMHEYCPAHTTRAQLLFNH